MVGILPTAAISREGKSRQRVINYNEETLDSHNGGVFVANVNAKKIEQINVMTQSVRASTKKQMTTILNDFII